MKHQSFQSSRVIHLCLITLLLLSQNVVCSASRNIPFASPSISLVGRRTPTPTRSTSTNKPTQARQRRRHYAYPDDDEYGDNDDHTIGSKKNDGIVSLVSSWKSSSPALSSSRARVYEVPTSDKFRPNQSMSFTSLLLGLNIVVYALQVFNPAITRWGVKLSERILRGEDLYRLVSPIFLHGDFTHLAMNSFSLQRVGPQTEQAFGSGRFMATYLVAGITGNLFSAYNSPNPALGASGAVFGIMGALWTFLLRHDNFMFGPGASDTVTQTIVFNLLFGVFGARNIDNWGHFGGFVGGIGMAYAFGPRLRQPEWNERLALSSSSFGGGSALSRGILIDEPILRLPRNMESIPEQILRRLQNFKLRGRRGGGTRDKGKPLRNMGTPLSPSSEFVPTESIRPDPRGLEELRRLERSKEEW